MSIWQTKSWQKMLKKSGQVSHFFEIWEIFIEKRIVALWEYWLFILWYEWEINKNIEKKLINLCKKENCLFIQIETINFLKNDFIKNLYFFKKWFYKKFITSHTSIIDLKLSEDKILEKMKPKWRYNIKLARKKWITIKEVEKNDENLKKYYNLMLETTSRDKFNWNNIKYYKCFLNSLKNSKLLLAYLDKKVIAWWIFIFDKEVSIYYYWASTSNKKYRNLMAPYLLQWEAIKIAKSLWSKIYDFLWITWKNDKNNELSWVTDFKLKLSKNIKEVSNSYICINKIFKYNFITIIKYFKNIIKK